MIRNAIILHAKNAAIVCIIVVVILKRKANTINLLLTTLCIIIHILIMSFNYLIINPPITEPPSAVIIEYNFKPSIAPVGPPIIAPTINPVDNEYF